MSTATSATQILFCTLPAFICAVASSCTGGHDSSVPVSGHAEQATDVSPSEQQNEDTPVRTGQATVEPSSLRQRLEGPDGDPTVAIFSDEQGLYGVGVDGIHTQFADEPFDPLAIDYALDVLWLSRRGHKTTPDAGDGLYVLDLSSSSTKIVHVATLRKGLQIRGADGDALPTTLGFVPYVIAVGDAGIVITMESQRSRTCGAECVASQEAVDLIAEAVTRANAVETTRGVQLIAPTVENMSPGGLVGIPGSKMQLRAIYHKDHDYIGYQIHDPVTGEYISSDNFNRAVRWDDLHNVQHLMVCGDGRTIVANYALVSRDFVPIDKSAETWGICLNGGVLFRDITGNQFGGR